MALPRNTYSDYLKKSLFEAVAKNNIKLMQQLMPAVKEVYHVDLIELRNENNQSLLHAALENHAYDAYVCLFNACKSEEKLEEALTSFDNRERSLLWYSVKLNNLNLVKQLLPFYKELPPNNVNNWLTADEQGATLLHLAAMHIDGEMLTFLINEINEKDNIINLINLYDDKRNTPLSLACARKATANIILLLQLGAAVYLENTVGVSFLSYFKKSPALFNGYTIPFKGLSQIIRHLAIQAKKQPANQELEELILLFTHMRDGFESSPVIENVDSLATIPLYEQIEKDKQYLLELCEKIKTYREYLKSDDLHPNKKLGERLLTIANIFKKISWISLAVIIVGIALLSVVTAPLLTTIIGAVTLLADGTLIIGGMTAVLMKIIERNLSPDKFQAEEVPGANNIFAEIKTLLGTLTTSSFKTVKDSLAEILEGIENECTFEWVDYQLEKIEPELNNIIDIMYQFNISITSTRIPTNVETDSILVPEQMNAENNSLLVLEQMDLADDSKPSAAEPSYAGYKGTLLPAPSKVKMPLNNISIQDIRRPPIY